LAVTKIGCVSVKYGVKCCIRPVTVYMMNVGSTTWTLASGFDLRPVATYPTWGVASVPIGASDNIARGQTKTFVFNATAPSTPGTYKMRWQMHRTSGGFTGSFGDLTSERSIVVTP
jgi:hypothetical protein